MICRDTNVFLDLPPSPRPLSKAISGLGSVMSTHRTWLFDKLSVLDSPSPGPASCQPQDPHSLSRASSPIPIPPSRSPVKHARVLRSTSTGLTFPPTPHLPLFSPIVTLFTYAVFAMVTLTGLTALLFTGYGLSAFDDARCRLTGVRGIVGKGIEVGRELVHGARDVVEGVVSAHQPIRSSREDGGVSPHGRAPSVPQPDHLPQPLCPSWQARTQPSSPGYTVPSVTDTEECDVRDISEDETDRPPHCPAFEPGPLPPRPPLAVLVGSLLLTLLIVAGRLTVLWWMGQQVPKNTSHPFRSGRRAFEAATRRGNQGRSRW